MVQKRKPQAKKPQATKRIDLNASKTGMSAGKVYDIPSENTGRASVIITNIYAPKRETELMVKSFEAQGHEVAVLTDKVGGNGAMFPILLACFKRAITGHVLFAYSDGADTFCQKPVYVPTDRILVSAEKNCYPHKDMAKHFEDAGPFKYLNAGGWGGPLALIIEFFEKYIPNNGENGQHQFMTAYVAAKADGFPIELDTNCEVFQTMIQAEEELELVDGKVHNKVTGTIPAILHGNGGTNMEWVYEGVK